MYRFTTAEAYDANSYGEPIMLSRPDVARILDEHGIPVSEAETFYSEFPANENSEFNAADVLNWLGY